MYWMASLMLRRFRQHRPLARANRAMSAFPDHAMFLLHVRRQCISTMAHVTICHTANNNSRFNSQLSARPGQGGTSNHPWFCYGKTRCIVTDIKMCKAQSDCHHQHINSHLLWATSALPVAQPTLWKHWRGKYHITQTCLSQPIYNSNYKM